MTHLLTAAAAFLALAALAAAVPQTRAEDDKTPPKIGHMVYFKLKDASPAARTKLVAACDKYLKDHPGTLFYAAGVLAPEFAREVNDRDWDVALHLVFKDKAAHDAYQDHPRHLKFIEENKDTWAKVRVFDSACK